jgi:outer membrane receptor protein involved in Fe transport
MTRAKFTGVVLVLLLLSFSGSASAQTTGSIRGRTVDTDGQALPGVTVVVTGEILGSARRTAVTSPSGGFQLAAMPVGTYTVTASLDGFQTQAAEDVRVTIGGVATVDFNLPEAFSDEITVIGETPIVDVASPSFDVAYDADTIKDLPTRGNFYDTLSVMPGVATDRENIFLLTAFGSDVQSNQWNIDGLDSTSPESGDLYWSMNDELIAELQMTGTGAGAEYGSMLGTAFNVVTKSGTNEFHGSGVLDFWVPGLTDENAVQEDAPEGAQTYRLDHHNNLVFTLGGPIVKDKLWFFAATEWGRQLVFEPYEEDLPEQKETTWDNYDLKFTAQLGNNHRFNLRFGDHDNVNPWLGDVWSEITTWGQQNDHTKMLALDYSTVLGAKTFLEARVGGWRGDSWSGPQYPSDEPAFVDFTVDPTRYYGGTYWNWTWEPKTDDAEVILTQHADEFLGGDHTFRFGVQYKKGGGVTKMFDQSYYYQYESYYYDYYNYEYVYYVSQYNYRQTPYYYGAESESLGAFVTDSWEVSPRLTLNIGVRYDRHDAWIPDFPRLDADVNPTGEIIEGRDVDTWTYVDPRFGFAWQPSDSGKTVIRGSIGRFHAGVVSGQWYSPPPEMPGGASYWLNGDGEWEYQFSYPTSPDALLVDGTELAETWEYTLGVEHQVGATSTIGLMAVYKKTDNLIGWHILDDAEYEIFTHTDPWTGQVFELRDYGGEGPTRMKGNTSGPGANGGERPYEQEYRGLILTYKKRFSNNWDMYASYTYSKSEGLNPTFLDWGSQGYVMYGFRSEANPNAHINADKALNADKRHMFRVVANYMAPWQLKFSTVANFQVGRPYDRYTWVQVPSVHDWTQIIAEPASNDQRYPSQLIWDLGIGKHFNLGRGTNLSVDLQILNLLNDDAVEGWRTREINPDEGPIPDLWVFPRRAELRLRFQF